MRGVVLLVQEMEAINEGILVFYSTKYYADHLTRNRILMPIVF
jgi:hypothetical protein